MTIMLLFYLVFLKMNDYFLRNSHNDRVMHNQIIQHMHKDGYL